MSALGQLKNIGEKELLEIVPIPEGKRDKIEFIDLTVTFADQNAEEKEKVLEGVPTVRVILPDKDEEDEAEAEALGLFE